MTSKSENSQALMGANYKQKIHDLITDSKDPQIGKLIWANLVEPPNPLVNRLLQRVSSSQALAVVFEQNGLIPKNITEIQNDLGAAQLNRLKNSLKSRIAAIDVKAQVQALESISAAFITSEDHSWPQLIDDLGEESPIGMWVRGELSSSLPIAIVGARACSRYAQRVAYDLAAELASAGATIVSGGAFGVDAAAHEGALSVGGRTIAFMAGGLDHFYPQALAGLQRQIIDGNGALLSEIPIGWRPARWRFLARNRLIAAFSAATVVVEASARSGALATARRALQLGRPVGAVPGPINSALSVGSNDLIKNHAHLISSAEDILEMIATERGELFSFDRLDSVMKIESQNATMGLDEAEQRVFDAFPLSGIASIDKLSEVTGIDHFMVARILSTLELGGYILKTPNGRYQRMGRNS
ncbi:DNA protecting protein DprA [Boudabousia liubingyangii]|uniref:DNA-processing protein DprA n=1 Tax=Boudabousia liubingyangii TaxID=1921764 RepID=UPI00093DED5F|nr:DNA-processing protein DprA [Boudabousia liubingyangii]OKL46482.1 DNA protecting protein DprA [Boudabousia liubingyangii]